MHPVEAFLRDVDAAWVESGRRIRLPLIGSAALVLQTAYNRGTKDSDILETAEVAAVRQALLAIGGHGTRLHEKHRIYLEVVGSAVPFLPPDPVWVRLDLGLRHFDIELLNVTDVVVTKLKRFHADDRDDVQAMVESDHVEHRALVARVREVVERLWFDARSDQLPRFVGNLHTVERDWFGVPETHIDLPEER